MFDWRLAKFLLQIRFQVLSRQYVGVNRKIKDSTPPPHKKKYPEELVDREAQCFSRGSLIFETSPFPSFENLQFFQF